MVPPIPLQHLHKYVGSAPINALLHVFSQSMSTEVIEIYNYKMISKSFSTDQQHGRGPWLLTPPEGVASCHSRAILCQNGWKSYVNLAEDPMPTWLEILCHPG